MHPVAAPGCVQADVMAVPDLWAHHVGVSQVGKTMRPYSAELGGVGDPQVLLTVWSQAGLRQALWGGRCSTTYPT